MAAAIRVREANDGDKNILLDFHRRLYQDHRDQVVPKDDLQLIDYRDYERILTDDLQALMRDRSSCILIAESRSDAIGYITGRITVETRRVLPRRGVVEDWYVEPGSRGMGVGTQLLRQLEQRFVEANCQVIESATWAGNVLARRAHDAMGFRETRIIYRKRWRDRLVDGRPQRERGDDACLGVKELV